MKVKRKVVEAKYKETWTGSARTIQSVWVPRRQPGEEV